MRALHPGEQVHSVMSLAPATNPTSCPPLWPSDLQMYQWKPSPLSFCNFTLTLSTVTGSWVLTPILGHCFWAEIVLLVPPQYNNLMILSLGSVGRINYVCLHLFCILSFSHTCLAISWKDTTSYHDGPNAYRSNSKVVHAWNIWAHPLADLGSNPASERSPVEGNGNPLQYSCLENPMDRGAWWSPVQWVAKSQTQLSK